MKCKYRNSRHKAVAPIIATLLMVAIAVVGGVMIFAFTQGFFKGTSTSVPTTDVLTFTGYDLCTDNLRYYEGTLSGVGVASFVSPNCGDVVATDTIAIHVKNSGTTSLTITSVKVNGIGSIFETGAVPTALHFSLATGASGAAADFVTGTAILPAGQEGTILYQMNEDLTKGAIVTAEVVTANGDFTYKVTVGDRK